MIDIRHRVPFRDLETPFLEILLHPNSSGTWRITRWILGIFAFICVSLGTAFFIVGATPVVGFMGLEVVLLYGAFWLSARDTKRREALSMSGQQLTIERVDSQGRARNMTLQPYWTRLQLEEIDERAVRVRLHSKGQAVEVGGFLPYVERRELATTLAEALADIRQPPAQPV